MPARQVAAATSERLEITRRDVALVHEHVGLRHVLRNVIEVVPTVVLLGLLRRDVEHGEQDSGDFHGWSRYDAS